jgi:hypothetical protein
MKIKVSELAGAKLDYWVAKTEQLIPEVLGATCFLKEIGGEYQCWPYKPSSDWSQGGPIIERESICVSGPGPMGGPSPEYEWTSYIDTGSFGGGHHGHGRTPLVAAMRAFVYSKFGEEVEEV